MQYQCLPNDAPLAGYAYVKATRELHVLFKKGRSGTYHDISAAEFAAFKAYQPGWRYRYLERDLSKKLYTHNAPAGPRAFQPGVKLADRRRAQVTALPQAPRP